MNELSIPVASNKYRVDYGHVVYRWSTVMVNFTASINFAVVDIGYEETIDRCLREQYDAVVVKGLSYLDNFVQFDSMEQKTKFLLTWS